MDKALKNNPIKILWQKIWLPDFNRETEAWVDDSFQDQIPNIRRVSSLNSEINVPDPKAVRSMSRASLFLSAYADELKVVLSPYLEKSPFSVGIYCAVENGPIDASSTVEILNRSSEVFDITFAEAYRKLRNPKMYLKQLPNLAPAQLGISLGIQGPMNVYTNSMYASQQAIEQAEADVINKKVDAALILTAHAFDDFWVVKRTRTQDDRTICEGAAFQIITLSNEFSELSSDNSKNKLLKKGANREYYFDAQNYFGISDPLINLIRKGN